MKILTLETDIPYLDTAQMMEVDRAMIEDYRIDLTQMMENAGRCLAILARDRLLHGILSPKRVTVMAGRGGNGGGVLVAARRLHNFLPALTWFACDDGFDRPSQLRSPRQVMLSRPRNTLRRVS